MVTLEELNGLDDEQVVRAAQAFLETQDRHNLRVLLNVPEPVKHARFIRRDLQEALSMKHAPVHTAVPVAMPTAERTPDPNHAMRLRQKAESMVAGVSARAWEDMARKAGTTIEACKTAMTERMYSSLLKTA